MLIAISFTERLATSSFGGGGPHALGVPVHSMGPHAPGVRRAEPPVMQDVRLGAVSAEANASPVHYPRSPPRLGARSALARRLDLASPQNE